MFRSHFDETSVHTGLLRGRSTTISPQRATIGIPDVALGTNGALIWFGPVQPVLAVGSLALLGLALRARLRANRSCPSPAAARP